MKIKHFSILLLAALSIMCCKKEPEQTPDDKTPEEQTKPIDEELDLKDGEIAFPSEGEFFYENTDGVLLSFEDDAQAVIYCKKDGALTPVTADMKNTMKASYFVTKAEKSESYFSVYPAGAASGATASGSGATLMVTLPSEQDGTLSGANIAVARTDDPDKGFAFRNICGLLRFTTTTRLRSVTISSRAGEPIIGTLPVTGFDEDAKPVYGSPKDVESSVKVVLDGRIGTFYVALLPDLELEEGFAASFEPLGSEHIDDARYPYSLKIERSTFSTLGTIDDYIPHLNWFVTPEGSEAADGKSWETAISAAQMMAMLALNHPSETGTGTLATNIKGEEFADYLKEHNSKHAVQLDGVTFHLSAGNFISENQYVRCSFPEIDRLVTIKILGGYDPASSGTDTSKRNPDSFVSSILGADGGGTARAFLLQSGLDMAFDGITFTGGTGDGTVGGGALLLNESEGSKFLVRNCKFVSNSSNSTGGAVTGSNLVGEVSFENCVFSKNTALKTGGAVHCKSGKWTFSDCSFAENRSTGEGGAIYMIGADTEVTITGGSLTDNASQTNAGAIAARIDKLSVSGTEFKGNKTAPTAPASAQGGAVYCYVAESGAKVFSACSFEGNSVDASKAAYNDDVKNYVRGGAIYIGAKDVVKFENCSFKGNFNTGFAENYKRYGGGALYTLGQTAVVNCTFEENSGYHGGGVYVENGATTVTGGTFKGNTAEQYGGAFYISGGSLSIGDASVEGNRAAEVGGAAYCTGKAVLSLSGTTFSSNEGKNRGGALYGSGTETQTVKNCTFEGNFSVTGGAIDLRAGKWEISGSQFNGNYTTTGLGGAIYANTGELKLSDCIFDANQAKGEGGGAVYVTTKALLDADGCTFKDNSTASNKDGGAVLIAATASGVHKFRGSLFTGNSSRFGAAVRVSADAAKSNVPSAWFDGCRFTGNTVVYSDVNGGIVYSQGNACLYNCYFSGNAASGAKGGYAIVPNNSNTSIVMNTTVIEGGSKIGGLLFYYNTCNPRIFNNVILAKEMDAIRAGFTSSLNGTATLAGCNYISGYGVFDSKSSVTLSPSDTVTDYAGASVLFDGFAWSRPTGLQEASAATADEFLTASSGGADFKAWLVSNGSYGSDIAGTPRGESGWYPGCYQGN